MTETLPKSSSDDFVFWTPPEGMTLSIGADEHLDLPNISLPICAADAPDDLGVAPSERLIGEGIYAYLCVYPETGHAPVYADILRQAYPFLISDIGSQLLLLDLRPYDAVALQKKIPLLKILLLLDENNFGLLHKLGVAFYHLALHPDYLIVAGEQLKCARQWLEKARRISPQDVNNLNYLGQVCYLSGNYHQAKLYWQNVVNQLGNEKEQTQLQHRLDLISQGGVPLQALQHQLEQMGQAHKLFAVGDVAPAYELVERLVVQGELLQELPNAEFYHLIGLCREAVNDLAGAYEAFTMATQLDDKHEQARNALKRVSPVTWN
jgi:tetratricopeptide (TPR) repeat protein